MPVTQGQNTRVSRSDQFVIGAPDRPVFIGGCPRSGTTLLGAMIHAHPELAIPPETRFVIESYKKRADFGDLRDASNRKKVGKWITSKKKTRFKDMDLDADEVVKAVQAAPPTIGSLSGTVLREFARAHGASRWGDKRPKYVEQLDILLRLYPDLQFIHLIRDARGPTASLKELGWWGWEAPEALDRWQRAIHHGFRAREELRADQYIELRYEDLVENPERELRRLCTFLGVEFHDRMFERREEHAQLIDKPYHERLTKPIDKSAVEKWRNILTPEELALVEAKVGHLLDEFGYERLTNLPPLPAELSEKYDSWREERDRREKRRWGRLAKLRATYSAPVAARLTSGQKRLAARSWVDKLRDALPFG